MSIININGDELVTENKLVEEAKNEATEYISQLSKVKENIIARSVQYIENGLGYDLTGYEVAGINFFEESIKWVKRDGNVLHYFLFGFQKVPNKRPVNNNPNNTQYNQGYDLVPYYDMYYSTIE